MIQITAQMRVLVAIEPVDGRKGIDSLARAWAPPHYRAYHIRSVKGLKKRNRPNPHSHVAHPTRTHYWYSHEPAWYVRKPKAPWYGKPGENATVWDSPSPKFIMGGSDEQKFDHPTQKPVELMRRPILNHTKRGELVYEPFLGSGTTLAAAELTGRVCCGIELAPQYVDVVVQRWQDLSAKKATLEADGRSFEEIANERRTAA